PRRQFFANIAAPLQYNFLRRRREFLQNAKILRRACVYRSLSYNTGKNRRKHHTDPETPSAVNCKPSYLSLQQPILELWFCSTKRKCRQSNMENGGSRCSVCFQKNQRRTFRTRPYIGYPRPSSRCPPVGRRGYLACTS